MGGQVHGGAWMMPVMQLYRKSRICCDLLYGDYIQNRYDEGSAAYRLSSLFSGDFTKRLPSIAKISTQRQIYGGPRQERVFDFFFPAGGKRFEKTSIKLSRYRYKRENTVRSQLMCAFYESTGIKGCLGVRIGRVE
jgi:hypothetical protein